MTAGLSCVAAIGLGVVEVEVDAGAVAAWGCWRGGGGGVVWSAVAATFTFAFMVALTCGNLVSSGFAVVCCCGCDIMVVKCEIALRKMSKSLIPHWLIDLLLQGTVLPIYLRTGGTASGGKNECDGFMARQFQLELELS